MRDSIRSLVRTGGPITSGDLLKEIALMTRLGTWEHRGPTTKAALESELAGLYADKLVGFDPVAGWHIVYADEIGRKHVTQAKMFD